MLPFLKNKMEASMSGEDDPITRKPDDEEESLDMLSAIAEDMLDAIHKKDKNLLKSALDALCEHIQDMDEKQDESLTNEEPV